MDLPGHDAWKTATPPEYEREEKDQEAPSARPPAGHRHYCHEWDLMLIDDSMPEFSACLCYRNEPPEEDLPW